jgi:hypothetical protein
MFLLISVLLLIFGRKLKERVSQLDLENAALAKAHFQK